MKKFTFLSTILLCSIIFNMNAQQYIKIDASFYSEALDEVKNIDIYLPGDYIKTLNFNMQPYIIYMVRAVTKIQDMQMQLYYYNLHAEDTTITSPPAIFVCPDGSCVPYLGSCWMNSDLYGPYGIILYRM